MPAARSLRSTQLIFVLLGAATIAPAQLTAAQLPVGTPYGITAGPSVRLPTGSLPPAAADNANDPAETLARYLRTLADSPNDLAALTGAGHAALAIGDANAALAFYARAEEISPRDGRIKAGLGSAMLQLEKPKEAIGLFDEAIDLGVSESAIASDRGLAWDLRGDAKRAQRSYALALRANPDDETTRRMALSLAISGDMVGANIMLDPLLRRQDRAAWRARAFILAMSGDVAAAEGVARSAMSPGQVAALRPFLVRLAGLRPAQKALAVNFGEISSNGTVYSATQLAAIDGPPPIRLDSGLVPIGEPWGPRRDATSADAESGGDAPASTAPRRRPGLGDTVALNDASSPALPGGIASRPSARFAAPHAPTPDVRVAPAGARAESARITPVPSTPIIAVPAAAAPAPTFVAATAPPATPLPAADAQPGVSAAILPPPPAPPAIALASADRTTPTQRFTLDPSIVDRAGNEVVAAARPDPIAAIQADAPPPAPINVDTQDKPVALPEVGYKLPPAKAKPVPAATEDTQPAPAPKKLAPRVPAADEDEHETKTGKATPRKDGADGAQGDKSSAKKTSVKGAAKAEAPNKSTASKKDAAKTGDAKALASDAKRHGADDDASAKKDSADKTKGKKSASKDDDETGAKPGKPDKASPQRFWVQVAGGATKGDLPKAWSKLKGKAPSLTKGQSAYTTPLRATNRLLVGPFKSADEAQAYVNRMDKAGLSGFTFTSDKGQQVDKLDTGK